MVTMKGVPHPEAASEVAHSLPATAVMRGTLALRATPEYPHAAAQMLQCTPEKSTSDDGALPPSQQGPIHGADVGQCRSERQAS